LNFHPLILANLGGFQMGGYGSGFRSVRRKRTTEESLTLRMTDMRQRIHCGTSGTLLWSSTNKHAFSASYAVEGLQHAPVIVLEYYLENWEPAQVRITILTSRTALGGVRTWFQCPLSANGSDCNRRVGCLYLPPGAKVFGCRTCHRLTYKSCQKAHRDERILAQLGIPSDMARAYAGR